MMWPRTARVVEAVQAGIVVHKPRPCSGDEAEVDVGRTRSVEDEVRVLADNDSAKQRWIVVRTRALSGVNRRLLGQRCRGQHLERDIARQTEALGKASASPRRPRTPNSVAFAVSFAAAP